MVSSKLLNFVAVYLSNPNRTPPPTDCCRKSVMLWPQLAAFIVVIIPYIQNKLINEVSGVGGRGGGG